MPLCPLFRFRPMVRYAVGLAALGVLLAGLPAAAQTGAAPVSVTVSCPARAPRGVWGRGITVTVGFTMPADYSLARHPRVTVTDAAGKGIEMLPTAMDARHPNGRGHRQLHSWTYRPGTYQIRAEVDYRTAQGSPATATSEPDTFVVEENPARPPVEPEPVETFARGAARLAAKSPRAPAVTSAPPPKRPSAVHHH